MLIASSDVQDVENDYTDDPDVAGGWLYRMSIPGSNSISQLTRPANNSVRVKINTHEK